MLKRSRTWETSYESGPQGKIGYSLAQLVEQRDSVVLRRSVHAQEGHVGDVLQRDVDVLAHLTAQQGFHYHSVQTIAMCHMLKPSQGVVVAPQLRKRDAYMTCKHRNLANCCCCKKHCGEFIYCLLGKQTS
jgi:hypothetical protein